MSKTVDDRVVEMRFDNAQFEKGVATSMSTIDKLKAKLNFKDADKSLSAISDSARKVDMGTLSNGVQAVTAKFSALQVIGTTALANITNSAVNTGKKLIAALTVNPVKDGLSEYETQMNAVQTILANTQKEGTNVKIVNKYLDELNTYADKTIYNFTEMTRNIGTFTAAGVKLDTSVSSIKGIANLAAVSGSSAQQASTAMYQLSQAIAAGKVQLMDWNSVVNAGMGGQVFQDALVRTSEHLKTGAKQAIETYGSFRESLTKGEWLTTEVLTQTLDQFATAADTQEEYEAAVKKFVEQGYSQEEAKQMADMAKTAGEAATKVKTFSQLIDTCKEALGSGWTTTWRLIFGDFEDARTMWTKVSDVIGGLINKFSDARNKVLSSALYNSFSSLSDKIKTFGDTAKTVTNVTEKFGETVDQVINGDFGNGAERVKKLTDAGMDWAHIQNLVNEKLGDSTRHATDYKEAQEETTKAQAETIETLAKMSDAKLTDLGFTQEEIWALRDLQTQSEKTGKSMEQLLTEQAGKKGGRELLLESFGNIASTIGTIFSSIGKAWSDVFDPITSGDIYSIIEKFHSLTESMTGISDNADKLRSTFKGLFVILKWGSNILGGGFKLAIKIVSLLLDAFGLSFLDVTAAIGDFLSKVDEFISEHNLLVKGVNLLADGIKIVAEGLKELYDYVSSLPEVQSFLEKIKGIDLSSLGENISEGFKGAIEKLKEIDLHEVGTHIISGLKNGLGSGIGSIIETIANIANKIISTIKDILDIHSPSKVMIAIGGFIIAGLIAGLLGGDSDLSKTIQDIGGDVIEGFKAIDWGQIFAGISTAGLLDIAIQLSTAVKNFSELTAGLGKAASGAGEVMSSFSENIGQVMKSVSKAIKGFGKILSAKAFKIRAEGIKELAESVLMLAGAVYILAQLDKDQLIRATACIAVLSVVLTGLTAAVGYMSKSSTSISKDGIELSGMKTCLVQMGLAVLMMAECVKIMGKLDADQATQGFSMLVGLCGLIVALTAALGKLVDAKQMKNISQFGKMMTKLAWALLLTVAAVKLIGLLSPEEAEKGILFAIAFSAFMVALGFAAKLGGKNVSKLGSMMIKMAIALALMVGVVKLVNTISPEEADKAKQFAESFTKFMLALAVISRITKNVSDLSKMMLSVSASLLIMSVVMKIIGSLSPGQIAKGIVFMTAFGLFIAAMVAVLKIGPDEQIAKVGATILAISVSLAIMAAVCVLLGMIELPALAKGIVAMGLLSVFMAGMITATQGAEDCKGSIIAMAVAIGVMAAAVAVLSFIKWDKLVAATVAMASLMGMFALMELAAKSASNSMGAVIAMAAVVAVLGAVLITLSTMPWANTLAAAASLSITMLALSAAMVIISTTGAAAITALPGVVMMGVLMAALTAMLYILAQCNPEAVLPAAESLSILLLALSASLVILAGVGAVAPLAVAGATTLLAFIGIMSAVLLVLGGLAQIPGVEKIVADGGNFLATIGYAIGNFVGSIVGGFAAGVTSGLPDIADNLCSFGEKIQPFIASLATVDAGDFVSKVGALTAGILLLTAADFISGIVSFMSGGSTLSDMGTELSQFMINAMPFITSAMLLNEETMNGVKALAETIMILTAADLLDGITSWITGGSSLSSFGEQLIPFGEAIAKFSATVSGKVDSSAVEAAANAGEMMAKMADTIPNSGGVVSFFTGNNDIDTFGEKIESFGKSIAAFSAAVSGKINEDAITAAANAGSIMVKLAETVPNTGGVVSFFTGDNDMETFGKSIESFGKSIAKFSNKVKDVDEDAVATAARVGEMMTKLNEAVPDEGGVKGWWFGDNDLSDFGDNISDFGEGIAEFSESVKGKVSDEAVSAALTAANKLVYFAKNVDGVEFDGLENFESALSYDFISISDSLETFSNGITDNFDSKSVDKALSTCRSIVAFAKELDSTDLSVLSSFGKTISSLADNISGANTSGMDSFSKKMKSLGDTGIDKLLSGFKGSASKASAAGALVATYISNGVKKNSTEVTKALNNVFKLCINTIKSQATSFRQATQTVMKALSNGILTEKTSISGNLRTVLSSSVSTVKSYRDDFYKAGAYLVKGLANGISDNDYRVEAKAKAMANKAVQAAEKALDEHSPSKVFYRIGKYIPMGMVKGIDAYADKAEESSKAMARSAVNGASYAMTALTSMIDGDIDMSPRIRPVVDMSNVEESANSIGYLLNKDVTFGVSAHLNSINNRLRSRNQNDGNAEVVSAINKLRGDISGMSKPTYQIDGITYDDRSSVADAIDTLIDAVVTERRI